MKFALIATAIASVSAVRMGRYLAENAKDELATFQDFLDAKNDMNVKQNAYVKLQHAAMAEEGKLQKEIDETMAQEKITHAAQSPVRPYDIRTISVLCPRYIRTISALYPHDICTTSLPSEGRE